MPQPFDIHKAKAGVPVITRGGQNARILCFDAYGKQPVAYQITNENYDHSIHRCSEDGYYEITKGRNFFDLMHPDEEMYVNVYSRPDGGKNSWLFSVLGQALAASKSDEQYIGTYKLVKVEP